jgi:hypothetical protein
MIENSRIVSASVKLVSHDSIIDDLTRLNLIDEIIVEFLIVVIVSKVVEYVPTANADFGVDQIISELIRLS